MKNNTDFLWDIIIVIPIITLIVMFFYGAANSVIIQGIVQKW